MAGGGGGDVVIPISPRAKQPSGRRSRSDAAWLPLDIITAEIATRSDPATLVRCAATCRDARRRIARDHSLLGRLRLRNTERFVLPLLRGQLMGITTYTDGMKTDVYMVDTTAAADATHLVKATFVEADETLRKNAEPLDSRGGLVLIRNDTLQRQLLVCNLATRHCLALPPEPAFPYAEWSADWSLDWSMCDVQYVLLVGGSDDEGANAAVGRPFQVLMVKLVLSQHYPSYRRLLVHIFSSEHRAWSPLREIPTPYLHGSGDEWSWHQRPLVVGDVVHWLCVTNNGGFMLMLHVGAATANVTSLPVNFPRDEWNDKRRYLLATATAGGNPVVLFADTDKISAWEPSKHNIPWKQQPQPVIENETILGFKDDGLAELVEQDRRQGKREHVPELLWFGERSGTVLLRVHGFCLLWLDLHSKKIVRCFSSYRRMHGVKVYCPYEMDLSSWVPTFSSAVIL